MGHQDANLSNFFDHLHRSYELRQTFESWSLRTLVLGIAVCVAAIGIGSAITPPKAVPTPPAAAAPPPPAPRTP